MPAAAAEAPPFPGTDAVGRMEKKKRKMKKRGRRRRRRRKRDMKKEHHMKISHT